MKALHKDMPTPASPGKTAGDGSSKANIFKAIRDRIRYRLVLQSISDMLEWVGITIVPYYTFEESFADKLNQGLNLVTKLAPISAGFLSYPEIAKICRSPEGKELEMDREKLLGDDCRCFALKHDGEVVSYMLCNFRQCDSRLVSYPLKEGEVYLTDAYTFNAYRGKNLAAVLEYELYKQLIAMGQKKYHSINVLYNAPGLRFKEKLQAKPVKLCLFIRLFNKLQRNFTLRSYRK